MPDIISYKIISKYFYKLLANYFEIKKIRELVARKYFWLTLKRDIEGYIKKYDIYITFKVIEYKSYKKLQSLPILIHH